LIGAIGFLLYANTLSHEYALDDKAIITKNRITQKGFAGIPELLSTPYWYGLNKKQEGVYRPLSPITFAIEIGLWGEKPGLSHLVNILLYIICGLLLYHCLLLLFEYPRKEWFAMLVTTLFLVHPIHTEVVANIKGRDEILAFLLLIFALYSLLKNLGTNRLYWLILSGASYFFAMLSKESAIVLLGLAPFILIVGKNKLMIDTIKKCVPLIISTVVYLFLYFSRTQFIDTSKLHLFDNALSAEAPAFDLLATKFLILGKYITLFILPYPLVYDYSYNTIPIIGYTDPGVIGATIVILLLLILVVQGFITNQDDQRISFLKLTMVLGAAWFLISVSIVSNIFFLTGTTMAERLLFTPSLGYCLAIGSLVFRLDQRSRLIAVSLAGFMIISYSYVTIDRNPSWENDARLFSSDIKHLPNSSKAHHNYANILEKQAEAVSGTKKQQLLLKAISQMERSIVMFDRVPELHNDLADLYGKVGDFNKAISSLQRSLAMNSTQVKVHLLLGKAYGMTGKLDDAISTFNRVVESVRGRRERRADFGGVQIRQQAVQIQIRKS
ncbi:MAG: tetratricopeptide repeat protein, partial [Bacteroidetes bacterium]|nr:tetratricopeptide repeat protein [Bacteroidota bacterium]